MNILEIIQYILLQYKKIDCFDTMGSIYLMKSLLHDLLIDDDTFFIALKQSFQLLMCLDTYVY